ncbi:hypothetical protein JCM16303_006408 [Sporobolomyces ruberrimus]
MSQYALDPHVNTSIDSFDEQGFDSTHFTTGTSGIPWEDFEQIVQFITALMGATDFAEEWETSILGAFERHWHGELPSTQEHLYKNALAAHSRIGPIRPPSSRLGTPKFLFSGYVPPLQKLLAGVTLSAELRNSEELRIARGWFPTNAPTPEQVIKAVEELHSAHGIHIHSTRPERTRNLVSQWSSTPTPHTILRTPPTAPPSSHLPVLRHPHSPAHTTAPPPTTVDPRNLMLKRKRSSRSPFHVKREYPSPTRVKRESPSPTRVKRESPSPTRVKRESPSPTRVKRERSSPTRHHIGQLSLEHDVLLLSRRKRVMYGFV